MYQVIKCAKCQQLLLDQEQNLKTLRYNKVPKSLPKIWTECPTCLSDEYLEDCLCEELITAPNVKTAKEIAERNFPDYHYLMPTSRGCSTNWLFKNFIFIK